jgi:hypothetical protein
MKISKDKRQANGLRRQMPLMSKLTNSVMHYHIMKVTKCNFINDTINRTWARKSISTKFN